jgi:hypothetical protein
MGIPAKTSATLAQGCVSLKYFATSGFCDPIHVPFDNGIPTPMF